MNLAIMSLTLYLRNPTQRSALDGAPLIVLPNGRRIVIESVEYDVTRIEDTEFRSVSCYRVSREYDKYGWNRVQLGMCADLQDVAKHLANESKWKAPYWKP